MKKITIIMRDKTKYEQILDEDMTYEASYGLFIVKRKEQWIGIYNLSDVSVVEVH